MPDRFSKVTGQIYRGGKPSAEDLRLLSDVYRIKTIISLDGTIGAEIAPLVEQLGMEHIVIPIGGRGSMPLINYLRNNIASLLQSTQPVYVHCRHGSDRTGMAVALHRIQNEGWDPQTALSEARAFGFGDKLDPDTEQLYLDAINGDDVSNAIDSDVVSAIHDQFMDGTNPPAYSPQQSFSAPDDYKYDAHGEEISEPPPAFKDPYAFVSRPLSGREDRRKELRRMMLETLVPDGAGVPQVGGRDGGQQPMGVGPTETGGFLNI